MVARENTLMIIVVCFMYGSATHKYVWFCVVMSTNKQFNFLLSKMLNFEGSCSMNGKAFSVQWALILLISIWLLSSFYLILLRATTVDLVYMGIRKKQILETKYCTDETKGTRIQNMRNESRSTQWEDNNQTNWIKRKIWKTRRVGWML